MRASWILVPLIAGSAPGVVPGQTIDILRGKYGASAHFCNAAPALREQCDGLEACVFRARADEVCPDGVDPYPGVQKKLTVKYRCGNATRRAKAHQSQTVELTCAATMYRVAEDSAFVGHVFEEAATDDPACGGALADDTGPHPDPSANCVRLCVELPPGATVKRIHGWAKLANKVKWRPCHNDPVSCDMEQAAFLDDPVVRREGAHSRVCWIFRNWSVEINREARVTVDYQPSEP